jgi:hypothetical protein
VRLYGHPTPPTDDDVVREVHAYAQERLGAQPPPAAKPAAEPAPVEVVHEGRRGSGIVEID